jgi:hypothetical protein
LCNTKNNINKKRRRKMKKLLFIFAVLTLGACTSNTATEEVSVMDSVSTSVSEVSVSATPDSTVTDSTI